MIHDFTRTWFLIFFKLCWTESDRKVGIRCNEVGFESWAVTEASSTGHKLSKLTPRGFRSLKVKVQSLLLAFSLQIHETSQSHSRVHHVQEETKSNIEKTFLMFKTKKKTSLASRRDKHTWQKSNHTADCDTVNLYRRATFSIFRKFLIYCIIRKHHFLFFYRFLGQNEDNKERRES